MPSPVSDVKRLLPMSGRKSWITSKGEYYMTLQQTKAVILGHAIGDALGVPVEFKTRKSLDGTPVMDMTGFNAYHIAPGVRSNNDNISFCQLDNCA